MKRKFLTKTARTQLQTIMFFRDPFRLVPVNDIAEIADKLTRNEILTSNEIRQLIGMKPSDDPKADKLINSNLNQPESAIQDDESMITPDNVVEQEEYPTDREVPEDDIALGNMPISSLQSMDN